jgi:hypothetical protein
LNLIGTSFFCVSLIFLQESGLTIKEVSPISSSSELYNRLFHPLRPLVHVSNIKQLANWLWITVGILQADSIALSKVATYVPGSTSAEARVTQIRRRLMNFRTWRIAASATTIGRLDA